MNYNIKNYTASKFKFNRIDWIMLRSELSALTIEFISNH